MTGKVALGFWISLFCTLFARTPIVLAFDPSLVVIQPEVRESRSQLLPEALPVRRLPREDQMLYLNSLGEQVHVTSIADYQHRREQTIRDVQSLLGDVPGPEEQVDINLMIEEVVDRGTYLEHRISYQSEPNGRVPAYLLIPHSALVDQAIPHPAVLCLHPTHDQGYLRILGHFEEDSNRNYAQELALRGYVVLVPSYPLLANYQPDLKALGWKSGLLKATWDNRKGLDLLDSLPYVRHGQYGAIGHSLGGHNAVYTALFDDRLQVVVSSCGLDSMVDYYNGDPAVWQPERGWTQSRYIPSLANYAGRLDEIPYDFHEMISALAPRHVYISAPIHDDNFRADSVDRVAAAARPVFKLYGVADRLQVVHPHCKHDFPSEIREEAYKLLDRVLKNPLD